MTQYLQDEPSVLFRQKQISDLNDIKFNLDNGTPDYALTYTPLPDPEYQWTPLIREHYYALVSRDHPLSQAQSIDLSTLAGERILLNGTDSPDFIEEQCLQSGFSPLFAFIGEEYEVLGPLVALGLGISFISTLGLYDMKKSLSLEHLSRISLLRIQNDSLSRTLGVLFKKHSYRSPVSKNFYKKLTAYFKLIDFELNNVY